MKSLIISLCFILLFASTNPSATAAEKVMDSDMNPLQPGVEYYARYFTWPDGGTSLAASIGVNVCPLTVIRSGWPEPYGIPITIRPKEGGTDIVELSNVFIEFKGANTYLCPNDTTVWRVNWDRSTNKTVITVGGSYNNCETFSEFQIQRSGQTTYRFLFRPFYQVIDRSISQDGTPDGENRLVLDDGSATDVPFHVFFEKKTTLDGIRLPK